jgi:hypothetical protein
MSATIEVAILAHDHRSALEDLIDNVRFFVPEAEVVVFNGGADGALTAGLDVDVCPYSRPLRLGNLVRFHWGVFRWLEERRKAFDFLVVLDSDQLFVRQGFGEFLERAMATSEFMAGGYLDAAPGWYREWNEVRRINYSWRRRWRPLYGVPYPAWGFNPGTVFRQEFMERASRFPNTQRIVELAARSRLYGIEEFVHATMAKRLGCNPLRHPGSLGLLNGYPSRETFERCLEDPNVFLLHKVHMELAAPDRRIIRDLRQGRSPDLAQLLDTQPDQRQKSATMSFGASARGRLKDLYFRVMV